MNIQKLSLSLACSAIALTCAAPVWAQSTTPEQTADPAGPTQVPADAQGSDGSGEETIIVTGTNISGVKPVGNTAVVLSREDAVKAGYSTPAELLRTLPQNRPSEYEFDGGSSTTSLQNAGGQSTIDLRGLGGSGGRSSTLLLIDGRRVVNFGTNQAGTEANQVPLAALERIEIIADGASAVYGADAVAGVVNYIVRKDFQGAELSVRGNNQLGGFEYGIDGTVGTKWSSGLGDGNILVAYSYTHRDPYIAGKNRFLRSDARGVGGLDRRIDGNGAQVGFIPNIVVQGSAPNTTIPAALQYQYFGLPAGANVGLTAAQLRQNDPNRDDFSFFRDYVGKLERHQVAVYANQELGESVEVYFQGNYLDRETLARVPDSNIRLQLRPFLRNAAGAVTATPNPYYISGVPGVAPGGELTVQYATLKDEGARGQYGSDESYNLTGGVRVKMFGDWQAEAYYTYGRNKGCGYCIRDGYINQQALQYQVDIGAINPLSSLPLTAAQRATFTGSQTQYGYNSIDDAVIKFNGSLFDLPAGAVKAAFGGERLKQSNANHNVSVAGTANAVTTLTTRDESRYSRTVWSGFGELYLPLVGEDMNIPLIKSLTVNAAVRYDDYSDLGNTTNPKFGATWDVTDFLSIYGSWGKSYVAPSLTDKNPSAYVSALPLAAITQPFNAAGATAAERLARVDPRLFNAALAPFLCNTIVPGQCVIQNFGVIFGSNPDLQPQKATQWTLGATLKPGAGFRINVNYFNIDYRNRIVFPQSIAEALVGIEPGSSPPSYRGYEGLIIPINNPATCSNSDLSTADPFLQSLLSQPIYIAGQGVGALGGFPNYCSLRGIIDSRFTNLARTKTSGLDIDVSWNGMAGEVALNANVAANVILENNEIVAEGQPVIDRLDLLGDPPNPLKWRGRASIGAAYRGFTGTLFGNYYGSFINNQQRVGPANQPVPEAQWPKVKAYTTFDLNLGYYTDFEGREAGFLKGLRGSLTLLNVFDRDPQVIVNKNGAILEGRGSPFGRTVSFQITGSF